MADLRPILICVLGIFLIAGFLNFFISPFVSASTPSPDSILYSFSNFIENGVDLNIPVPVFGTIDFTFNPITMLWLGIDGITDFIVEQLNLLSYLPDVIIIPYMIIVVLVFGFTIWTLVRGN